MHRRTPPPNGIQVYVDGARSEEALGPERVRLGVLLRTRVREPDRRRDVGPGREREAVDAEVDGEAAARRAARPGAGAATRRRPRAGRRRRRCGRGPSRPGGARAGRATRPGRSRSSRDRRSSSVISWSRTSLIVEARGDEHRADVRARRARRCAISSNSSVSMSCAISWSCSSGLHAAEHHRHLQAHRGGRCEQVAEQRVAARSSRVRHAEDRRRITSSVIVCMLGWTANARRLGQPSSSRSVTSRIDRLVRAHAVAVERRQHHLASRQVLLAFQQEQRAGAHQRLERDLAPGRHVVAALAVQRSDHVGVRDDHERRLEALERDAERRPRTGAGSPRGSGSAGRASARSASRRLARAGDRAHDPEPERVRPL